MHYQSPTQATTPMKLLTIASRHMSQVYSKVQHRPQSSETESGHHGLRKLRQEILHHALSITNQTTTPMKRMTIASRHMSQVYSNVQHRPQSSETESGHHGLRKLRQEILHHALSITNQTTTPMKRAMTASRHMSQVYSKVQHRPQSSETESGHHGLRKLRQEILHHALSITNQTTTPMKRITIASRHMSQVYSKVQHRPQSSETESGHHGLRKLRQEILHHALSITNQTTTPMKRAMTASHHMSQVYSKVQHRPQPSETESGHHGLRKLRQEILHHALSITNASNHTNEIIDDCKPPHVSGLFQSATPSAVIRNRIGSSWSQKAATGNPASCIINHQPNNHTNEKNDDCKPPHVPGLFQRATPSAVIRNRIGSSWSQKAATGNPASCIINHQPNNHTNEKSNDCKPPHVSGLFQSATPSAVIRNRIGSSWSQKAATGNPASCIINHQPNNHTNEKNNDCKPPHVPGLFQRATPSAAIRNRIGSSWSQKAATGNPASCIINHQPNNHTNEKNDDCKPPHVPGLFQRATPSAAIRNRIGSSWSQKAATGNPASCIINHQPNNHTNEKNNDCTPPHVSGLFQRATPSAVIRNRIGSSWSQKAATGNPASCIINHQPNNHTNEKNDDCKPPHVPGLFQRATPSAVIRNRIGSSWSQKAATGNPASCIINHQPNNHTNEKNNDCKPPHVPGLFQSATPSAVIRNRIGSSWSQKAATGNPASCIINHQPNNHTNEKSNDCKPPHVSGLFQSATPSAAIRNRIGSSWSQKAATGNPASCIINHQPNNHINEKNNDCKPPHVSGLFQRATPSAVIRNRIGSSWSQKAATGNPASCIINHQPNNHTNEKNNDCKPPHVPGLFQRATPSAVIRNRIGSSWSQKAATGNPASCIINHQPNNHTNEKSNDCKPPHVSGLFQSATPSAAIRNRIGSSWSQKAATGNPASCIINHQHKQPHQ